MNCDALIEFVKSDMKPSLGVTEPGAISYACAAASALLPAVPTHVEIELSSGILKNSYTCAIAGTDKLGCAYAAALGAVIADPSLGLMTLQLATDEKRLIATGLTERGEVVVHLGGISSRVYIKARVSAGDVTATALITDRHDNLVYARLETEGDRSDAADDPCREETEEPSPILTYTLKELYECASTVDALKLDFIAEAIDVNRALYESGEGDGYTVVSACIAPTDSKSIAKRAACGAIEARVRGAALPAMSITGSGSHGILCTLPVAYYGAIEGAPTAYILRAVFLSCLVTEYIKACSGRLSPACGCVLAGGSGSALGLTMLMGADYEGLCCALEAMAASVTGMICHGGNPGCVMKAATGIDTAFLAADMGVAHVRVGARHGILASTPEKVMANTGKIASEGMRGAEHTILDIMTDE